MSEALHLRLTDAAEDDLAEIWAYIAEDSDDAATRLLDRIETACQLLPDFPMSGVARHQLGRGLRAIFEGNYAIYYTITENEIVIVRVLHGARDVAALSEQGGFSVT